MPSDCRRLRFRYALAWLLSLGFLIGTSGCFFETAYQAPRILFMGNSITRNQPFPDRGWTHDWGMAATALENDYVHQTAIILKGEGMDVEGIVADRPCPECDGGIDEQVNNLEQVRRLRPRYVVVQLSEHSGEIEIRSGKMARQYRELLQGLADAGVPHVYCLGSWGEKSVDDMHNQGILDALRGFPEVRFLDISAVAADSASYADTTLFSDAAVRWHPGDIGMRRIAAKLAEAIREDR